MGNTYRPNALKPLKKAYELKNIAVFDIETPRWLDYKELKDIPLEKLMDDWHGKPIKPFLIGFYDHVDKKSKTFDGKHCMRDFLRFYLTKKNRNKITYAHNGGQFDFTSLHETLATEPEFANFTPQLIYVNGATMVMRIKDKNKHVWQFRDSLFLVRNSLEQLCDKKKGFNPKTKKLKMPPYPYYKHKKAWKEYCVNDCMSLAQILEILSNLIVHKIGGSMGMTTSSTAMRTFRLKFLDREIPTYFRWNDFIRGGYYGGRVEVFNMLAEYRDEPYYHYDVNSMYPSVMHDNIFPVSLPKRVHYKDPWDCAGLCGIMECDVETPEELDIPVLPYRDMDNFGRLLFPLGRWRGTYEFSLIEKALQLGYRIRPLRTIEFEGANIFKEYVDTIYPMKKNGQGAVRSTGKLLGNGLYGKFGERSERSELITDPDADITGTFPIPNDPFGYTTRKVIKYCAHHLPAIAVRVTALSQLKLYSALEMMVKKKATLYYCDTDSMITDTKMRAGKELGEWDIERKLNRGVFLVPKGYCYEYFDEEKQSLMLYNKFKGFTKDFKTELSLEDYKKALPPWNDYTAFNEPRMSPASFKEIFTRGLKTFSIVVKPRSMKQGYEKRTINEDYSTEPLRIG